MNIVDLGIRDYKEVWEIQKRLHQRRVDERIDDTLVLVEHTHVVTMGKSGNRENILISPQALRDRGIAYYEIERGGDVTYHGPGQLVGYPIMNIKHGLAGIRPYIMCLEKIIINTLHEFGITGTHRNRMVGVWTTTGKICSIGVAVKRWVSFHGFALNVSTDLSYFNIIHPCGLPQGTMTSMQQVLNTKVPMTDVKHHAVDHFSLVLNRTMETVCLEKLL
jgi:lipoate-protein ligase B